MTAARALTVAEIAEVAHEANRTYCAAMGDHSHQPWMDAPEELRRSVIHGVQTVITHREITPQEMHDNWRAEKRLNGWHYGPSKSLERKEHPNMKAWTELPESQRRKDVLFCAVVRALYVAFAFLVVFALGGRSAAAQTITPITPNSVFAFTASSNHSVVVGDQPVVTNYVVEVMGQNGLGSIVWTQNLGKPTPNAQNEIVAPATGLSGALQPNQVHRAVAMAVGPGGSARSALSNPFAQFGAPAAPGVPIVREP